MHVDESGSISHKDNTKYYVLSGAIVNIDEIVLRPPSAENAKRLVEMQIRVVTQSTLLKKLPEDWLPYMINAGFFKDLPAHSFYQRSSKLCELGTISISHKMCKCISKRSYVCQLVKLRTKNCL